MPLHSQLGFIRVHDLLAIQEDRGALPDWELSLQNGGLSTTEDLNTVLGLRVLGRWAHHRPAGGRSDAKDLRFRGFVEGTSYAGASRIGVLLAPPCS